MRYSLPLDCWSTRTSFSWLIARFGPVKCQPAGITFPPRCHRPRAPGSRCAPIVVQKYPWSCNFRVLVLGTGCGRLWKACAASGERFGDKALPSLRAFTKPGSLPRRLSHTCFPAPSPGLDLSEIFLADLAFESSRPTLEKIEKRAIFTWRMGYGASKPTPQ